MRIRTDIICHAKDSVYERLVIEGLDAHEHLTTLIDRSLVPNPLPCRLYPLGSTERGKTTYVAVTPRLSAKTGAYCIGRLDEEGRILETQARSVNLGDEGLAGRLGNRLRREACEELLRVDERRDAETEDTDRFAAELGSVIAYGDGTFLVRVSFCLREDQVDKTPTLICLDDCLDLLADDMVLMGRANVAAEAPGEPGRVRVTYSLRVPEKVQTMHVYLVPDEKHPDDYQLLDIPEGAVVGKLAASNELLYKSAASDPYHEEWLSLHRASERELQRQRATALDEQPMFSIVVPLFKTPAPLFTEMLGSVLAQTYQHWELILVNASPAEGELARLVEAACAEDERVRSVTLEENLGISLNTNAGAALATGDFVCFLDHDDTIEPDLFFEYALAVNEHDDIDLIYCDEDKILPDGSHLTPFFKPDFSLDFLRSNNYICHLLAIRRRLFEELPPNTPEFDGAQDFNLVLQCAERGRTLHHVPKVLYHWRITESSTSGEIGAKDYAIQAGERALRNHLARTGVSATVVAREGSATYRIIYDVPSPSPLVSIIIPSKDQVPLLDACVRSIFERSTYDNFEVIVVENNSVRPETFSFYEELKQRYGAKLRVVRWEHEFNFSKIVNFGASHARGDYYVLLNNDTEVITGSWLELLLGNCARSEVGAVGARLYYPDDTIQHAGVCVTSWCVDHLFRDLPRTSTADYFQFAHLQRNLSIVTAACMMVRKQVFESVGGFTEELAVTFNDVDFCLKLGSAGLLVVYDPDVELYHYESISRGDDSDPASKVRELREISLLRYRWPEIFIYGDPYFTPNITRGVPEALYYKY